MTRRALIGSICSGYGGLDLGIEMAVPEAELAWVADYEPPTAKTPRPAQGAARILAHRYPGVPNLGDITATDWVSAEPVDIIAGGTPCQDVSAAGARRGMRPGTRSGIWSSMVNAIEHHRPTLVVWENVGGAFSAGADSNVEPCPVCVGDDRSSHLRALGRVLGDLSEIGYDARWVVVSAADVGAVHRRERVFVGAWPSADPDSVGPVRGRQARGWGSGPANDDRAAPDTDGLDRWPRGPQPAGQLRPARASDGDRESSADPMRAGLALDGAGDPEPEITAPRSDRSDPPTVTDVEWGDFTAAIRRWEHTLGRVAPAPTETTARGGQGLAPVFVEWMMGLPEGWVTDPAIWAGMTRSAARNAQLKALGNGVVPQQGAAAVAYLLRFAPAWVRVDLGLGA